MVLACVVMHYSCFIALVCVELPCNVLQRGAAYCVLCIKYSNSCNVGYCILCYFISILVSAIRCYYVALYLIWCCLLYGRVRDGKALVSAMCLYGMIGGAARRKVIGKEGG